VLPLDTPPHFRIAIRLTALGGQAGFTFSMALVAADIAGQLAPPHQRPIWFGLAGGTAALLSWWMWGRILKRIGIC
jgi:hypothetical protein